MLRLCLGYYQIHKIHPIKNKNKIHQTEKWNLYNKIVPFINYTQKYFETQFMLSKKTASITIKFILNKQINILMKNKTRKILKTTLAKKFIAIQQLCVDVNRKLSMQLYLKQKSNYNSLINHKYLMNLYFMQKKSFHCSH